MQAVPALDDRVARGSESEHEALGGQLRDRCGGAGQHRRRARVGRYHGDPDARALGALPEYRRQRECIHAAGIGQPKIVVTGAFGTSGERNGIGNVAAQPGERDGGAKARWHGKLLLLA